MDAIILAVYAFLVWFIFIKKRWLTWITRMQVIVVIIMIVGMTILIMLLKVVATSTGGQPDTE